MRQPIDSYFWSINSNKLTIQKEICNICGKEHICFGYLEEKYVVLRLSILELAVARPRTLFKIQGNLLMMTGSTEILPRQ